MALITCPECHGQVSDKATTCPHCGYPIAINNPQEQYAFCVKSQPIPTSTVQAWERFTALRLTMEIAGVSTGDAEKMLSNPGSILKDKLTEQEAAAVVLNYQRLHIPTAVEQSNYTLREVEKEKQEAQEAFLKKRAAEDPNEFFVFKKIRPMLDILRRVPLLPLPIRARWRPGGTGCGASGGPRQARFAGRPLLRL